jgi:hypothetical protein
MHVCTLAHMAVHACFILRLRAWNYSIYICVRICVYICVCVYVCTIPIYAFLLYIWAELHGCNVELNCVTFTVRLHHFVVEYLSHRCSICAINNGQVCFKNIPKMWLTMVAKEFVFLCLLTRILFHRSDLGEYVTCLYNLNLFVVKLFLPWMLCSEVKNLITN